MTIDYNRLEELADTADPGPWTVTVDEDWDEVIVANDAGHLMSLGGGQVRFEMKAGKYNADPHLAALAPDMARELLRLRDEIKRTRDRVTNELDRIPVELQAARITMYTEREHTLDFCNHLLEGQDA